MLAGRIGPTRGPHAARVFEAAVLTRVKECYLLKQDSKGYIIEEAIPKIPQGEYRRLQL